MDFKPPAGQMLTVRFGGVQYHERAGLRWLSLRPGDGSQRDPRMTNQGRV